MKLARRLEKMNVVEAPVEGGLAVVGANDVHDRFVEGRQRRVGRGQLGGPPPAFRRGARESPGLRRHALLTHSPKP